ncbi:hypothetical protein AB0O76_14085 [Streptomyces sp. NPDC086554]|uniref:hypothetical protein n=1 Tax=Streptomyces sp. NPDC086554 TaxID=3154864 RepID=UPI003444A1A0
MSKLTVRGLAAVGVTVCGVVSLVTANPASASPREAAAPEPPIVVSGELAKGGKLSRATCPKGTQLGGGGYSSSPVINGLGWPTFDFVIANAPSKSTPNSWSARMLKGTASAYALCYKSSSEPPVVVTGPVGKSGKPSYATCPEGTQLAGGGYYYNPVANGLDEIQDTEVANAPSKSTPNTWAVQLLKGSSTAFALCNKV